MSDFAIDILDADGEIIAPGPLATVISLDDTKRLDAIGSLVFTMPANDPRAQYIAAGVSFRVHDRFDGLVGTFYYRTRNLSTDALGNAILRIEAHSQLIELARHSVNFRRNYTAEDVDAVIADLVSVADDWSAEADEDIGTTTVSYEGESVLAAVDVLRDRWNQHYRLNDERVLGFGAFGADSGIVFSNLAGQVQGEIGENPNLAIISNLELLEEADEIFNRVIPLGAGQGIAQLTIETATLGSYTVQEGTNDDGSSFFYIENAASVAAYGRRDKVLVFPQIRPITNSDANIINAANALKLTAEAYIARHLVPRVTYGVTVNALRNELNVGDTVRVQYRRVVDGYTVLDLDEDFYLMDLTRRRRADGTRDAQVVISTVAERRTSDTDIVLEVIRDVRALKVNVPITLAYSPVGPYIKRMDSSHTAEFTVRLGNEVTFLNYAILRFRTSTLKSSVTGTESGAGTVATTSNGGGQTSSSDGSHTHTVTISSHTHDVTISNHTHTVTISSHTHDVTTNDHSHDLEIRYKASPEGVPVYYNATNHYLNGTIGGASNDATTSEDGGGEVVTSASGGSSSPTSSSGGGATITSASGGGSTPTSASGGSHTHTVSNHTHTVTIDDHSHAMQYGIFADTTYPQVISLAINGVDVTTELGGTWAPTNASVEVEVDITDYLVNAVGGLRQNHRVEFSCTTGQGEIEAEVDILCSIQAIQVS